MKGKLAVRLAFVALSALAGGCGWINNLLGGTDNSIPPSELRPLSQPLGLQLLWQTDASSGQDDHFIELRPALNGGRLFAAGHDGDVSAFNAATGDRVWRTDTGLALSAGVGLSGELVLIGSINGEVVALSQRNGSEVWRAAVTSEVVAAPSGDGATVLVRSNDGGLIGLAADSGERRWRYDYTVPVLSLRGASQPLLAQGVAIVGLGTGRLLLLNMADGSVLGERTISPPRGRTELDRINDIDAELKLDNGVVFVAAYQGNVSAVDLRGGETLWSRSLSSYSGLDVDRDQVYLSDESDTVWALDRAGGSPRWQQDALRGRRLTGPAVVGNFVVLGDLEGYLHWLDKATGELRGRLQSGRQAIASAPLADAGVVYVLDSSGRLSAVRALPGG